MNCTLCPRKCNVDRTSHIGFCGQGEAMRIARIAPHFFEEPPISHKNGSGTVFFCGCNLRCIFCQNRDISRSTVLGKEYLKEDVFNNKEARDKAVGIAKNLIDVSLRNMK